MAFEQLGFKTMIEDHSTDGVVDLNNVAAEIRYAIKSKFRNARFSGSRAFLPCPFHREKTPSLSVSLDTRKTNFGSYFCFGCGAHGFWSNLAYAVGGFGTQMDNWSRDDLMIWFSLLPITDTSAWTEPPKVHDNIQQYLSLYCAHYTSWKTCSLDWRGFSVEDMLYLNAYAVFDYAPDSREYEVMALFPVVVHGEIKGAVRCGFNSKLYLNIAGNWRTDYGLLFFDHARANNGMYESPFIVVCEGVRDAARLNCAGIPAVALLGTQGWNATKTNLLFSCTDHGSVGSFYLGTDPDLAGRRAQRKISPILRECGVTDVVAISYPTDYTSDDGKAEKADIMRLNEQDFDALVTQLQDTHGFDPDHVGEW